MAEYVGQSYGQTVTCTKCGARVDNAYRDLHTEWHAAAHQ